MARHLGLSPLQGAPKTQYYSYDLHNQRRFYGLLCAAFFVHLFLLGALNFEAKKRTLKKMTATMFEVATKPQSITVRARFANVTQKNLPAPEDLHQPTAMGSTPQSHEKSKFLANTISPSSPPIPLAAPIRKRAVSAASHQSKDAQYLSRWQTYVEEFGNAHYPQAALKNNLQGELRLLVGIRRDGTIYNINLRKSSGSPILDQAAIDLVRAAAPFEPLPADISEDIEVLEIIRTWQFRGRFHTTG